MSYVLIVGAKSDIARAVSIEYARHGYDLYLAARNAGEMESFAGDLRSRFDRQVKCLELDILACETHEAFYAGLDEKPAGVVQAVGYLGSQNKAQTDFLEARTIIDTNFTGVVSLLNVIADDFERRGSGFIVGISSVAGDRGRKSNYTYGSAKAALTAYLSGLRNRLSSSNVHVLTVKPGFVDTSMTAGMNLPPLVTSKPEAVARSIYRAQQAGKSVLYTKWIWRWIMLIIKTIPEPLFKKMNL